MTPSPRRARRPDSLGSTVSNLVDSYGVPLPTHMVRILLTDRGMPATAESLGSLARHERHDTLRTRLAPRLCSAIHTTGEALVPRWWARGEWTQARRVLTADAQPLWLGRLIDGLCLDLADRTQPAPDVLTTLTLGFVAQLFPDQKYFDVPRSSDDWMNTRARVLAQYPGVTLAHDITTTGQLDAEKQLRAGDLTSVELYFGRGRKPVSV